MDKLGEAFMKEYLSQHTYGNFTEFYYNFDTLFKMFAALDIKTKEDLLTAPDRFKQFVLNNANLITVHEDIRGAMVLSSLNKTVTSLKSKIRSAFRISNTEFAEIVKQLTSPNSKILDVGSGDIPASSIIIAETLGQATSMDTAINLPETTLERLGVEPKKQLFDKSTSVKGYDMVVGKYPCSAIVPIVTNCAKDGVPYIIKLCNHDIPIPNTPKYIVDWQQGWQSVLPDIDAYIKFYDEYAFNVDLPEEKVKQIIDEHEKNIPRFQKQQTNPEITFSKVSLTNPGSWFVAEDEKQPQ